MYGFLENMSVKCIIYYHILLGLLDFAPFSSGIFANALHHAVFPRACRAFAKELFVSGLYADCVGRFQSFQSPLTLVMYQKKKNFNINIIDIALS